MADAAKRKLVEVFIDTDSESESHTSSEVATVSTEEVGVVSEGEEPRELGGVDSPEMSTEEAVDPEDSSSELEDELKDDFTLYDRDEDVFQDSRTHSPINFTHDSAGGVADSTSDLSGSPAEDDSEDDNKPLPVPPGGASPGFYGDGSGSHGDRSGSHGDHQNKSADQHTCFSPQSPEFETNAIPSVEPTTPILYCLCGDSQWDSAMIECHSCHKYFHGSCVGISRLKAALLKYFYCPLCIDRDPELVTEFSTRVEQKPAVEERGEGGGGGRRKLKNKRHNRRCGECAACLNTMDCRQCKFCKDLPKYGGPGRIRQKCIKRQCLFLSKILQQEIAHAQELKSAGVEMGGDFLEELLEDGGVASFEQLSLEQSNIKAAAANTPLQKKKPLGKRGRSTGNSFKKGTVKKKARPKKSRPEVEEIMRNAPTRRSRRPCTDLGASVYSRDDFYTPTQCLGPGCTYEARPNSKYCTEECGIQLALKRIKTFLPARKLLAGNTESIATKKNRARLKELDAEQKAIKNRLDQLDKQTTAINDHMARISSCTPTQEEEVFEAESEDLTIHCASCSQPVTLKKAMVHLERCFNKVEGVVSFGSIVKNEGTTIFCDKYDSSQKTYCKRLKVLCPEHTKEPKIGPKEVCGCPLDPLFPSVNKECHHFCEHPRKTCIKHYCWEKLRRAEIDQEKLNLYLKLEEVGEHTRLQQWQLDHRHSLLAVMFHHTIDHSKESTWNGHPQGLSDEGEGGAAAMEGEKVDKEVEGKVAMGTHKNVEEVVDVVGMEGDETEEEGTETTFEGVRSEEEMEEERVHWEEEATSMRHHGDGRKEEERRAAEEREWLEN